MTVYHVEIRVMPRAGLLDPQGQAVEHALRTLGFADVTSAHVGKHLVIDLEAPTPDAAAERARAMCERLLANPVIEDFLVTVAGAA